MAGMDLIPIGEAAHQLGMRASALRYYDERGLVPARTRRGGRRMYGREELRRLAFVKLALRLAIPLETVRAVFDDPGPRWRETIREEVAALDGLIEQAQGARAFLDRALECPADNPARDCPELTAALDRLAAGESADRLGQGYS